MRVAGPGPSNTCQRSDVRCERSPRVRTRLVAGVAALVGVVTACGGDSSTTRSPNASPFHVQVHDTGSGGSEAPPLYSNAVEATPGTRFLVDGVEHPPASDLLVVGRVADVRAGRSFSWPDGPQ